MHVICDIFENDLKNELQILSFVESSPLSKWNALSRMCDQVELWCIMSKSVTLTVHNDCPIQNKCDGDEIDKDVPKSIKIRRIGMQNGVLLI